jgi:hypothetical protein
LHFEQLHFEQHHPFKQVKHFQLKTSITPIFTIA